MRVFGEHEENTLRQLHNVAERAEHAALMADGHLGYVMPIGGVAAYRDEVSVVGVGFDIACGNAAVRTDLHLADFGPEGRERRVGLGAIADEINDVISFGLGRTNKADDAPVDHPLFDDPAWDAIPASKRKDFLKKARSQLGTVGSGNHYIDIFADQEDRIWVGVHFGSRGFGHTVASAFLALGQGRQWGERVPEREVIFPLDSPLGHDYYGLMQLAGRYAYAGREWAVRKVVDLIGGRELELVHNHHNFAWRETHYGHDYIVIRKGATPAFPGQMGFIGGSMGDDAVIVRGAEPESGSEIEEIQKEALYSTVHGAGRVMSRTAARGKVKRKTGKVIRPGRVSPEMMHGWVREKGEPARVPATAGGAGGAGRHHRCPTHAPAAGGGDGGSGRLRPVPGLTYSVCLLMPRTANTRTKIVAEAKMPSHVAYQA
jgi:tRNA-splicing ligase RtcB